MLAEVGLMLLIRPCASRQAQADGGDGSLGITIIANVLIDGALVGLTITVVG